MVRLAGSAGTGTAILSRVVVDGPESFKPVRYLALVWMHFGLDARKVGGGPDSHPCAWPAALSTYLGV